MIITCNNNSTPQHILLLYFADSATAAVDAASIAVVEYLKIILVGDYNQRQTTAIIKI